MLTGQADPSIRTNARKQNKNVTILEHLHRLPGLSGRIAVFSSWDRFPYILNATRSDLLVNSGRQFYERPHDSLQHHINTQLSGIPKRLDYRPDRLTYQMVKHHILKHLPRIVFIAFNDTDEYAHQGRYDLYLDAIHDIDSMIRDLHSMIESMEFYHGQTAYLVTTDHGRGDNISGSWRKHNHRIPGSEQVWLIQCIPGCPVQGEVKKQQQRKLGEVHSLVSAILNLSKTDTPTSRITDSAISNSHPCNPSNQ